MRRCDKHGRFGCADYDCVRAESARHAPAWADLTAADLPAGKTDAVNDTDRDEPIPTAEQASTRSDSGGE